ncbi:MAG: hypothetical protein LBR43_00880 [Spiroplasmataceae bacterium]|nr:hypothetical protein [Spiroplasmataceae bacterium]
MSDSTNLVQALQEFEQKQDSLTTGCLVLIDDQVHYFATKKEWEQEKENLLAQTHRCYRWVDCEKWHDWKNKSNSSSLNEVPPLSN